MMRCVIIDDEPLARECIENYITEVGFLTLAGTGNNPLDLTKLMETHSLDLIFLDIQMPVMNGIDFLKISKNLPIVVITTAYPNYALEGFQLDVMDYLVKPILFNRFLLAANKAKDYHTLVKGSTRYTQTSTAQSDYFFVKCGHTFERIDYRDLIYVEALENYVTLVTTKGKFITQLPLKNVEQYLSGHPYIRVHKSFIVSILKIEAIENNEISIHARRIPISRHYRQQVMDSVVNTKLWKK
jgi:DNA-binding LytR/AlgR family response regulator